MLHNNAIRLRDIHKHRLTNRSIIEGHANILLCKMSESKRVICCVLSELTTSQAELEYTIPKEQFLRNKIVYFQVDLCAKKLIISTTSGSHSNW